MTNHSEQPKPASVLIAELLAENARLRAELVTLQTQLTPRQIAGPSRPGVPKINGHSVLGSTTDDCPRCGTEIPSPFCNKAMRAWASKIVGSLTGATVPLDGHIADSLLVIENRTATLLAENVRLRAELAAQPGADWRERCSVYRARDGDWSVDSPCGLWFLGDDEWHMYELSSQKQMGNKSSEAHARAALAACSTPPPGVTK